MGLRAAVVDWMKYDTGYQWSQYRPPCSAEYKVRPARCRLEAPVSVLGPQHTALHGQLLAP
jgi:hypothetical protein